MQLRKIGLANIALHDLPLFVHQVGGGFSFVVSLGFLFFCVCVFHLLFLFKFKKDLLHLIEFFADSIMIFFYELIFFAYFL